MNDKEIENAKIDSLEQMVRQLRAEEQQSQVMMCFELKRFEKMSEEKDSTINVEFQCLLHFHWSLSTENDCSSTIYRREIMKSRH